MQKLGLRQTQQAKLSPKQLQFVQMLQIPSEAMLARIQEEIANNPTLEEEAPKEDAALAEEAPMLDYGVPQGRQATRRHNEGNMLFEAIRARKAETLEPSWHERLLAQLDLLPLHTQERTIATYLIGSLSAEGYLRTSLTAIIHHLAFAHYLDVDVLEVETALRHVQSLDPAGIGARDLRECLLLQLARKEQDATITLATSILTQCFAAFTKKNYRRIAATLKIEDQALLQKALAYIAHLSPKPITPTSETAPLLQKRPDFIVHKEEDGNLQVRLYHDYAPTLRIRKQYRDMLRRYHRKKDKASTEVAHFVQAHIQRAQWFMEALQKRRETLIRTMQAIVKLQEPFFASQDEQKLRPLFMRHVAQEIGMDVSTVSRVVRGKRVATDLGIYPLKYFFSEPMPTTEGDEASSRIIKAALKSLIDVEDKQHPYTDEALVAQLKTQGYILARRTVAKYRRQLGLPVARMRKAL